MKSYSLTHVPNHLLLQGLAAIVTMDRSTTADLLAHISEVDERKLYLPAAHASMHSYCVHELHMSDDVAYKRIHVARATREFPAILPAVADGRLNVSGALLLAPCLTSETVTDLLAAAAHKTNAQIELLLAERCPKPDMSTLVQAIAPAPATDQLAVRQVVPSNEPIVEGAMEPLGSPPGSPSGPHSKLTPLSPGRFAVQFTVDKAEHELLTHAKSLLGHALPSGDVGRIFVRGLREMVERLEKRKFAATARPRQRRGAVKGRHIPAEIRRAVWQRDGGQCTFVSEAGRRCEERTRVEFDHIEAVARGGQMTAANMRLRCAPHNQYAAECTFGEGFMRGKREDARLRAAEAKATAQAKARAEASARADAERQAKAEAKARAHAQAEAAAAREKDVIPWLRQLGFSVTEARRGAANCAHLPDASLEERVRVALRSLASSCVRRLVPVATSPE